MNREQMIAHLAEAGRDREALNKLSDCDLKALMGAGEGAQNQSGDEPTDGWAAAHQYRRELEELRRQTANARKMEEEERARLLDDVLYAKNRPWSDEEVRNMGINELRKVHAAVCRPQADYSGRGGPRTSVNGSFDWVANIMDGPAGTSVLDRKEAN